MTLMNIIKSKSLVTTISLVIIIITSFVVNPRQQKDCFKHELEWDVFSYYMYLPYTFIYKDVRMQKKEVVENIFQKYNIQGTYYQAYQIENGNYTPNYTLGFAILWSPFFAIGHLWATHSGYDTDGWSFPYQCSIAIGALIYILIGLFFFRRLLLHFFNETVTSIVMIIMVLGTNYFHETFNDYLQPHAMLFTGYCIVLNYTIEWHKQQKIKYIAIAGFVMGLMILARPSELLIIIIPFFWNVYNYESLKLKINLLLSNYKQIIILILCAFLPFIPQLIYWKIVTNSWIFFSYQHTEGFDFLKPHIINVLFSFKKSWFIYTPIIIFPIIAVFRLYKNNIQIYFSILVFFLANFYLLSSWAAWWNGGSFGMRYFVESYAVLSIPFGYLINDILKKKILVRLTFFSIIVLLIGLNIFQIWQYCVGIIPEYSMTYPYYKRIFLKTKVTEEDRKLMEVTRSVEATEFFTNIDEYEKREVLYLNFSSKKSTIYKYKNVDLKKYHSFPNSYLLKPKDEFGLKYLLPYKLAVPNEKDHAWIRVSLNYYSEEDPKNFESNVVISMPHNNYNLKYRAFNFSTFEWKKGDWNHIEFDYMTPFPYDEDDYFDIYIWHRGANNLWIDDYKVELFNKKPN
jgi:hypothetical protein